MVNKEDWDNYLKENGEELINQLKERNFLEEKEKMSKLGVFLIIFVALIILGTIAFFGYMTYENKFANHYTDNSACSNFCPECPICPSLPSIPSCPSLPSCPSFPNTLNVNIKNSS